MYLVVAMLLALVAGLRTFTAPAAVSWAVRLGGLSLTGTPLAFMGFKYTPIVFTVLAIGELIVDKLPSTPSRKAPPGFIGRILSGSLVGATVGVAAAGSMGIGLIAGALGSVAGTYGGAAARGKLATQFGNDLPAALVEDAVAIGAAAMLGYWMVTMAGS